MRPIRCRKTRCTTAATARLTASFAASAWIAVAWIPASGPAVVRAQSEPAPPVPSAASPESPASSEPAASPKSAASPESAASPKPAASPESPASPKPVASPKSAASPESAASSEPAASPKPAVSPESAAVAPPASVTDALDRALAQLRIAEAQGPDRQAAFDRVRAYLDYVYKHDAANRRARYYNARLLILAGRREEAIHIVEAWTNSPQGQNDWEGHFILGKLYQEGSYYSLAKPVLEKALSLNPREPRIHIELAKCETKMMDPEAAIGHVRRAVDLLGHSVSAPVYVLLAQAQAQKGALEAAERAARRAVDLAATAVRRDGIKIPTLRTLDQCLELSLQIKQRMLQADPQAIDLYLEISKLIQQRSQVAGQLADYQALDVAVKGLRAAGDRPPETLLLHAIHLFMKLGITDQAASLADQMVELYPGNREAVELSRALAQPPGDPPR